MRNPISSVTSVHRHFLSGDAQSASNNFVAVGVKSDTFDSRENTEPPEKIVYGDHNQDTGGFQL